MARQLSARAAPLILSLLLTILCAAPRPGIAHEGHDQIASEAAPAAAGLPRLTTGSDLYELVAVLDGARLKIYLDRFQDNAPVTDADITVSINDEATPAVSAADGTYTVASQRLIGPGLLEFVFDIKTPEPDLLIGKLAVPSHTAEQSPLAPWWARAGAYLRHGAEDHLILMSLVLLAGLGFGTGFGSRVRRVVPIAVLSVTALTAVGRMAGAHEGHDDIGAAATVAPFDTSRRLPDGKVFVPKPTQRILDVRTVVAKPETLPRAVTFVGRVITNPSRSGLVQSTGGGRVIAPEAGLPRLGQTIHKGDMLATVEPPMPAADRTTISERMGEIEQGIAVAEAKLRRLRPLAERQVVPQSLVVETEAELEGLYRRRDVVRTARIAPEVLTAPVDGVIAMARVVSGQVVQAQDVLFQIVDPATLWVEAYDYGDVDPAGLKAATAVGVGNRTMKLVFQGFSRTLQQQATVLQFAIVDPAPSIRVGQPVTVIAQRGDTQSGIVVERAAVVRGGNGETIVWRHSEPEYFEARSVRTEPFDAGHLLIAAGIQDGERIVIRGADLINQIR